MNNKIDRSIEEQTSTIFAEYRLLNAAIFNPAVTENTDVSKDLFVHEVCKDLYDSISELEREQIPLTANSVFQRAASKNINVKLDVVQSIFDIDSNKDVVITDMVKTLKNAKQALDAYEAFAKIKKEVDSNPIMSQETEDKVRGLLYDAESALLSNNSVKKVETFKELTDDYKEDVAKRKNGKQYRFNDPILDKVVTYGPAPGEGGLIAAATGMGKSAFCLNLINRFINTDVPCVYFSLEMGKISTMDRLISLRKKIPLNNIVNPTSPETFREVQQAVNDESKVLNEIKRFRFSECASMSLTEIRQIIKKFQIDIGQQYCIVVFDLLSMVKEFMVTDSGGLNFAQGIEVAINMLNAMAKELGFHYIAVLQMNRKVEDGRIDDLDDIEMFRPTRNSIKNSNAFLERCRWNISLFRPRYYAEGYIEDKDLYADMPDYCYIGMLKQNNGSVGTCGKYLFDPPTMTMTPVEDEEKESEQAK